MISLQQSVLIIFALTALFVSSVFSIDCYQCESTINENCGEKFNLDGVHKADCSKTLMPRFLQNFLPLLQQKATGCMRTIVEVGFSKTKHTIRSCYYGDVTTSSGCQSDPSLPYVKQIECDVCTDDLCNGSSVTGPIALTIVLLSLVSYCLL